MTPLEVSEGKPELANESRTPVAEADSETIVENGIIHIVSGDDSQFSDTEVLAWASSWCEPAEKATKPR
jgi:hypothetical protein